MMCKLFINSTFSLTTESKNNDLHKILEKITKLKISNKANSCQMYLMSKIITFLVMFATMTYHKKDRPIEFDIDKKH